MRSRLIAAILAAFALAVPITVLAAWTPPIAAVGESAPMLNSAGDHVYASLKVSDGTGVVTTVAAAGTYVTLAGTPLAAGEDDGSGCITASATTGKFTVATRCGVGEILLRACINDVVGANSAVFTGAWHRTRSGVTTLISPIARETEAGTAARNGLGCVEFIADAALSDTYQFAYDSGTNADTVTTRAATLTVMKIVNK